MAEIQCTNSDTSAIVLLIVALVVAIGFYVRTSLQLSKARRKVRSSVFLPKVSPSPLGTNRSLELGPDNNSRERRTQSEKVRNDKHESKPIIVGDGASGDAAEEERVRRLKKRRSGSVTVLSDTSKRILTRQNRVFETLQSLLDNVSEIKGKENEIEDIIASIKHCMEMLHQTNIADVDLEDELSSGRLQLPEQTIQWIQSFSSNPNSMIKASPRTPSSRRRTSIASIEESVADIESSDDSESEGESGTPGKIAIRTPRNEPSLLKRKQKNLLSSLATASADHFSFRHDSDQMSALPLEEDVAKLAKYLLKAAEWEFDVFKLDELSASRPLEVMIVQAMPLHFPILSFEFSLETQKKKISAYFSMVEKRYCYNERIMNPFHNHLHAADVTQTMMVLLRNPELRKLLQPVHSLCMIVAAAIHDFRHLGVTNSFLTSTNDDLAIVYSDQSILERFHVAEAFRLLQSDSKYNFLDHLAPDDYRFVRAQIVSLVLATDLAKGFEIINIMRNKISIKAFVSIAKHDAKTVTKRSKTSKRHNFAMQSASKEEEATRLVLMKTIMKCADISHAAKPLLLHLSWTMRITQEFYDQGDQQRMQGMAITPLCDRDKDADMASSQLGFFKFVVEPPYEQLTALAGRGPWNKNLDANKEFWQQKTLSKSFKGSFSLDTDAKRSAMATGFLKEYQPAQEPGVLMSLNLGTPEAEKRIASSSSRRSSL